MSYVKIVDMGIKIVATNKKAKFEYFLLENYEAGLELRGSEIKSIRAGRISLTDSYVEVDGKQALLINTHIAPYEQANRYNHDPKRPRRLLLHKREIKELWNSVRQKGVTIIPVKVYLKDGKAKIDIAIAKGKKMYDKRNEIAKRDMQRELERQNRKSKY
jgi:SsrA-binding protein